MIFHVGDKVRRRINVGVVSEESKQEHIGTVIYIHPTGRFCVVEFDLGVYFDNPCHRRIVKEVFYA